MLREFQGSDIRFYPDDRVGSSPLLGSARKRVCSHRNACASQRVWSDPASGRKITKSGCLDFDSFWIRPLCHRAKQRLFFARMRFSVSFRSMGIEKPGESCFIASTG